jgi:Zn-dependent oligopeptidase
MHGICGKIGGKSPYAKVPRDFVEAPSQMLENWCWQENMLDVLSKHKET